MYSIPVSITHKPEHMGRLPEVAITWPISPSRFRALCEFWRTLGVTLLMCNEQGQPLLVTETLPHFWQHVLKSAQIDFHKAASHPADPAEQPVWRGALQIFAVPIIQKKRPIGLLAALLIENLHGEEFASCCDKWRLDRTAMLEMAAGLTDGSAVPSSVIVQLLKHEAQQSVETELQAHSINSLTQNLETTYEELGLVYRISREMRMPENPVQSLRTIGAEILQGSRAESLVFLLAPEEWNCGTADDPKARMIHCGREHAAPEDFLRLAAICEQAVEITTSHLLYNKASDRTEFMWASGWLRHLVVIPIRQNNSLLAVMLAVNCTDGGDFTSIDVQLHRTVGDRIASFLENQRLYHQLSDLFMGLLHALINSVDAKDPYTCGHSERVAYLSRILAERAGLSPDECDRVYLAGLLHDVGKIGIPDAILSKPGKLTDDEFTVLKQHPQIGAHIIEHVKQIHDLIPAVLYHHERMDGRGYPQGLSGEEIPLLGRIVCLADCFDAMTTNRTYREAMPVHAAIAEIRRCSGTQFDPRLADLFLSMDVPAIFAETRQSTSKNGSGALSGRISPAAIVLRSGGFQPGRKSAVGGAACPRP